MYRKLDLWPSGQGQTHLRFLVDTVRVSIWRTIYPCCTFTTLPAADLWTPANRTSVSGAVPSTDTCRWPAPSPGGFRSGRRGLGATAGWSSPAAWRLRRRGWKEQLASGHEHKPCPSPGYSLADMDMRAWMGLQAIMHTIMMGKMEIVLPDMYMMNRFMGICFRGPRATSQHLCTTARRESGRGQTKYHIFDLNPC